MGGVPSVPRDPSRKVQVICAGYPRTGTSTMALAIEQLYNGPFLHGGTQILSREDGTELLSPPFIPPTKRLIHSVTLTLSTFIQST